MGDYRGGYHYYRFMPHGRLPANQRDLQIGHDELIHRVTMGQAGSEIRDSCFAVFTLVCAVRRQEVQLIEMLLERGVNINGIEDSRGDTPLHVALTVKRAEELVPLLLKHGADVKVKNNVGQNVFHSLCYNHHSSVQTIELAKTFIRMAGILLHERDYKGFEPIHTATGRHRKDLMELYLDHGVNVNALTKDGKSLLTLAAKTSIDNTEILKMLLERGADIHHKTNAGRTALHEACLQYNEKNVELLLSAGADVLAEDCNGDTPLSLVHPLWAEEKDMTPIIKVLTLKKCCQPNLIELKDDMLLQANPYWNCYVDCMVNISRMDITMFSKNCTFFDLLAKSCKQVAELMRNPDLEANFWLYDLSGFSMYAEDILGAFERARRLYRFMLERENAINEAVYHTLPELVVRKVVSYSCDPFEKPVF